MARTLKLLTGAAVVSTRFDTDAANLVQGSTVHYRAVVASDFTTFPGPDASFLVVNQPPAVALGQFDLQVRLRALGRGRNLTLALDVDEPASVTIQLLNRRHRVVRHTTVTQGTAGTFAATLSLKKLGPGKYTLHIVATDTQGATSNPIDVALRIHR